MGTATDTMQRSPLYFWRPIVAAFDPRRALTPDEVEALYVERPKAASNRIFEELQLDGDGGSLFLLCGSRGSGKTTELARIHHLFQDQRVLIEMDLQNTLPSPLSSVTLVTALGLYGLRLVHAWGGDPDRKLQRAFQGAVDQLRPKSGPVLDVGKILEGMGAAVTAAGVALATPPTAIMGATAAALAKGLQLHWNPDASRAALEAAEGARLGLAVAVSRVFEHLQTASRRPVLLLADGLDKLSDQQQLVQVLNEPRLLAELNVAMVLTGPINLLHSTEFNALRNIATPAPLYNLVVHDFEGIGEAVPAGVTLLEQMFNLRCQKFGLPAGWVMPEQIRALAVGSGGSIRDFVSLIRDAAKSAFKQDERSISQAHVVDAIKELRHFLQLPLHEHSVQQLMLVLKTRRPTADPHCEELLFNNYILCYPNGDLWYRPHEALVPWLEKQRPTNDEG